MAWDVAITLAAIGALVLFHGARATEGAAPTAAAAAPAAAAAAERDPWARILVIAACAAGLLALGAIVVPAVTGNDSAVSTTPPVPTTTTTPTSTTPPASTTTSTTSSSTSTSTPTTTIHLTTTNPTTTVPTKAPEGSVVVARASVKPNGRATQTVDKLPAAMVVRRAKTGEYRVRFPELSDTARARTAVSVNAGRATAAVAGWSPNGQLVVLLFDRKTGQPVSRRFLIVVSGPPLPKTT